MTRGREEAAEGSRRAAMPDPVAARADDDALDRLLAEVEHKWQPRHTCCKPGQQGPQSDGCSMCMGCVACYKDRLAAAVRALREERDVNVVQQNIALATQVRRDHARCDQAADVCSYTAPHCGHCYHLEVRGLGGYPCTPLRALGLAPAPPREQR